MNKFQLLIESINLYVECKLAYDNAREQGLKSGSYELDRFTSDEAADLRRAEEEFETAFKDAVRDTIKQDQE